jgi:hypothetical protein
MSVTGSATFTGDILDNGILYLGSNNTIQTTDKPHLFRIINGGLGISANNEVGIVEGSPPQPILFYTSGSSRLTILGDGNIGIGTTSPVNKLDIRISNSSTYSSSSTGSALTLYNTSATTNGFVGIDFISEPTTGNAGRAAINMTVTGNGTSDLTFSTRNTDMGEKMRITSAGKIGIGTTNPVLNVDIVGDSSDSIKLRVKNTNASGAAGIILNPEGAGAGSTGDATVFFDVNTTAWVNGVDKSDSSYRIANDVYGDFRAYNYFKIATNGLITFNDFVYNSVDGHQFSAGGTLNVGVNYNSTGAEIFLLNNRTANGTVAFLQYRTNGTTEGSLYGDGNGLSISNVSDYRQKEDIQPLSGSLNKIISLQPKTFKWKNKGTDETQIGLIAHEVQTVIPSMVVGEKDAIYTEEDAEIGTDIVVGSPKYQSVKYSSNELITYLIGSIKELKAEIDELKNK